MNEETAINAATEEEELKRLDMLFRAFMLIIFTFYRRSMVVGMGFMQARPDEEAKRVLLGMEYLRFMSSNELKFDTEYLFGRMMKTTFHMNIKTGKVWAVYSNNPEYTSWIGLKGSPSEQEKALICKGLEACMEDDAFKDGLGLEVITQLVDANA